MSTLRFFSAVAISLLFVFCSCSNQKKTTTTNQSKKLVNYSSLYNPGIHSLHPQYKIFHDNDLTSTLTGFIALSELQYNQPGEVKDFKSEVSIHYELFDYTKKQADNSFVLADSATYKYTVKLDKSKKRFYAMFPVKAVKGNRYILNIFTEDVAHNSNVINTLFIDKTNQFSSQNFELKDLAGYPFFEPYVINNSAFRLNINDTTTDSVYIYYYSPRPNLPEKMFSPTISKPEYTNPDSLWILPYDVAMAYVLSFEGLYLITKDSCAEEGVSLLYLPEGYPKIVRTDQMFEPLTYITTEAELDEIQKPINKKLAIDNFWIEKTKKLDAAKELIRIYYNRITYANYYFTSYKEGWKTDRGMVYVIYGPPEIVHKNMDKEEWIYYDGLKETNITFVFDLNPNKYCSNEYVLNRSESNNIAWQEAINTWRSGKIYTFRNP